MWPPLVVRDCAQVATETRGEPHPEVCFRKARPRKDAGPPGLSPQCRGTRIRLTLPALPWGPDPGPDRGAPVLRAEAKGDVVEIFLKSFKKSNTEVPVAFLVNLLLRKSQSSNDARRENLECPLALLGKSNSERQR